jgi:hypothetical protein
MVKPGHMKATKTILPAGIMLQARLMRRAVRRSLTGLRYKRWSFEGVPILFSNSFPKSGTHLLTQVLNGFTLVGPAVNSGLPAIVTFAGDSGEERSLGEIIRDFMRLRPGDIAYGHVHALPETIQALSREDVAAYFIFRDPRDVVVSHVHYVTEGQSNHILHHYYRENLQDIDQRLFASIQGIPDIQLQFPDIAKRFEPFVGWLDVPQVLSLRYEDFLVRKEETLGLIFDHALRHGFPIHCDRKHAIESLAMSIDPQRSPTFRSGQTGEWKKTFNDRHKQVFKELAGDLLIRLGYEQNYDW